MKPMMSMITGYYQPFKDKFIEIIPIIFTPSQKINDGKKLLLPYALGTEIKFQITDYYPTQDGCIEIIRIIREKI